MSYTDFTNEQISSLGYLVSYRLSQKRYIHTLGTVKAAEKLGALIIPKELNLLRAASLLHDIAKELTSDQAEKLALENDLFDHSLWKSPATRHALLGAYLIVRDFPGFADPRILSAVMNHTTGSPDMSLFDEIIFIADYIEDGRTYQSCIEVRERLYSELLSTEDINERIRALHRAVVASIDYTIEALAKAGREVSEISLLTKKAISALI